MLRLTSLSFVTNYCRPKKRARHLAINFLLTTSRSNSCLRCVSDLFWLILLNSSRHFLKYLRQYTIFLKETDFSLQVRFSSRVENLTNQVANDLLSMNLIERCLSVFCSRFKRRLFYKCSLSTLKTLTFTVS